MTSQSPTETASGRVFCFGLGFCASALIHRLGPGGGWSFAGTTRGEDGLAAIADMGVAGFIFNRTAPLSAGALDGVTHVLVSIPPDAEGDIAADLHGADLADLAGLRWVGVLSTTGVYGDTGGMAVDETAAPNPTSERARRRVRAESQWLDLWRNRGVPVHIFRLPGIYGPGRSALDRVRADRAPLIDRPGHKFSRIHVEDVANVLAASIAQPHPGAIYNVADDEAIEPMAVTQLAYELLGQTPPDPVAFEDAAPDMSPMQRSFWKDNRQVSNARIKAELGVTLAYPTYREGLAAVAAAENK